MSPRRNADHVTLYREIYDQFGMSGQRFELDEVDEEWMRRATIDVDLAKREVCKAVRRTVDTERTKFRHGQLSLPMLAPDDAYLVVSDGERVREADSSGADQLDAMALSDRNLASVFTANQAQHERYRQLAPYYNRGLLHNPAVEAYWRDRPNLPTP